MMNEMSEVLEELLDGGSYMLLNSAPMLISIAAYILSALGLYTLAKRRGIKAAWLSWVPVANVWILGSLADQFRYVAKGQIRSKRKVLLSLEIIKAVMTAFLIGFLVFTVAGTIFNVAAALDSSMLPDEQFAAGLLKDLMYFLVALLLVLPVVIALKVFRFMALYDVYLSCEPENSVLYILLTIFFSGSDALILFFMRNKDKGMPPRRPVIPAQQPPQPAPVNQNPQGPVNVPVPAAEEMPRQEQPAQQQDETPRQETESQNPQTPEYL